ncbi:regulator of hemoglobinization and erythroid cell expansion protein [Anomalospiza imberbis]|uniref:regulator of hemoglobinization and erythroid cell expansion protein n=1 Tax=Anomalospiza imberbis TaxID=187417 RepID=UPI00358F059F
MGPFFCLPPGPVASLCPPRPWRRLSRRMSSSACWIPAVTSLVTLILYPLFLLALYTMLSRKIAQHSCRMQVSSSPGEHPSPHPTPAPAWAPGGDTAQKHPGAQNHPRAQTPSPAYAEGSSDTSSDTSEDSDNPSCPQGPGSEENINYSTLVFPEKDHEPGSAHDYENVKTGMDYINVDPEKRKTHFWPFSSLRPSKGVEYTEVKLSHQGEAVTPM